METGSKERGNLLPASPVMGKMTPDAWRRVKGLLSDDERIAERKAKAAGSTSAGSDDSSADESASKPPPGHGCGKLGTADLTTGEKFPCPEEDGDGSEGDSKDGGN